jgi:hypothetical protein
VLQLCPRPLERGGDVRLERGSALDLHEAFADLDDIGTERALGFDERPPPSLFAG